MRAFCLITALYVWHVEQCRPGCWVSVAYILHLGILEISDCTLYTGDEHDAYYFADGRWLETEMDADTVLNLHIQWDARWGLGR